MSNNLTNIMDFSKAVVAMPNSAGELSDNKLTDSLSDFYEISGRSLIIVNDDQRSTPTYRVIDALRKTGKVGKNLTFLMATGTHLPPSKQVAVNLIGAGKADKILFHDINNNTDYSYAGTTSRGTNVLYNSVIDRFDNLITVGSVEPHYFAGFTGGAKSILPGIMAMETIISNHKWALDANSSVMKTAGNPVFEDIWEGAELVTPLEKVRSIQIVNHGCSIVGVCSGNLKEAFDNAREISKRVFCKAVEKKFDRIISIVESPLNKTVYQAQKALENCKGVLKDGGTLVLVADCDSGIGNSNFYNCLSNFNKPENVISEISFADYTLGDHKAYKFAETALKYELLYVGNLNRNIVSKIFMKKVSELKLSVLYKSWVENGDSILIDKAGGFNTFYIK